MRSLCKAHLYPGISRSDQPPHSPGPQSLQHDHTHYFTITYIIGLYHLTFTPSNAPSNSRRKDRFTQTRTPSSSQGKVHCYIHLVALGLTCSQYKMCLILHQETEWDCGCTAPGSCDPCIPVMQYVFVSLQPNSRAECFPEARIAQILIPGKPPSLPGFFSGV